MHTLDLNNRAFFHRLNYALQPLAIAIFSGGCRKPVSWGLCALASLIFLLPSSSHAEDKRFTLSALNPFSKASHHQHPIAISLSGSKKLKDALVASLEQAREEGRTYRLPNNRHFTARQEIQLIRRYLESESYYQSKAEYEIRAERLHYKIDTGPRYTIRTLHYAFPKTLNLPEGDALILHTGLQTGQPLRAQAILNAQTQLGHYISRNNCVYQSQVDYKVRINANTHSADLSFTLANAERALFGNVYFSGHKDIDTEHLKKIVPIEKGECYSEARVNDARIALIHSNLFASVSIKSAAPQSGLTDLHIKLTERRHRTVSAGIGFDSEEGFGLSAGWEHRNLFSKGQKLAFDSQLQSNKQSIHTDLTLPHFIYAQQSLNIFTDLLNEQSKAYLSESGTLGLQINRALKRRMRGTVGTELSFAEVENLQADTESNSTSLTQRESYSLLSFPLRLEFDTRNDLLNPQSGWTSAFQLRPYTDLSDESIRFLKASLSAQAYHSFNPQSAQLTQLTLALRAAGGTITGLERQFIPAHIRYYVGGGGSVRAYPYQSLGPHLDGKPTGGLSFNEFSVELRALWGKHWGGVVFVDGGAAYESHSPLKDEKLFWGTGLGLRYYTGFAPIRIDLAFPVNKIEENHDSYQFYISIGQAF